jgi:modulator of FtsH protease
MQTAPGQLAEAWKDFFVTAAGASATLVGLVIVAISVNLRRIIEQPQLPSRGGATVATLVLILVTSMAELIPQSGVALAIEISVFGLLVWLIQLWSARQIVVAYWESRRPLHEAVIGIAIGQIQAIPFIIGGISLLMRLRVGTYWIAWGMIATFILSVVNTWILLVEILR